MRPEARASADADPGPWQSVGARVAMNQLGFRPRSRKRVALVVRSGGGADALPEQIPFFVNPVPYRHLRENGVPEGWRGDRFPWPYDIAAGPLVPGTSNYDQSTALGRVGVHRGFLRRQETAWGRVWLGDFSSFGEPGLYQVETEYDVSSPFEIGEDVLTALYPSYLRSVRAQRSGFRQAGLRPAIHADDGVLDTSGEYHAAHGGWCDAGDARKWMSTTLAHLSALVAILRTGDPQLAEPAADEIAWGNDFFHRMISPQGQVYENVGGGAVPEGYSLEDWWFDNHSGCVADGSGNAPTDGIVASGDERSIMTYYNANVQFNFVRQQAVVAGADLPCSADSRRLAELAWTYGRDRGHDGRTLFVAQQLAAAVELRVAGSDVVGVGEMEELARVLLGRQVRAAADGRLSGYFTEADGDGFRSAAFSCEPVLALMRLIDEVPELNSRLVADLEVAVRSYVDDYLVADAGSNPFGVPPYGVWSDPPFPDRQVFRPAGGGAGVRTFMATWTRPQMVHGTSSVVMQQAWVLAWQGRREGRRDLLDHAEDLLQWVLGWNTTGLSLFTGFGSAVVQQFSAVVRHLPDAAVLGFIGRPDDTPYLEQSRAVEWSTQEAWGPPFQYAVMAARLLEAGPIDPGATR